MVTTGGERRQRDGGRHTMEPTAARAVYLDVVFDDGLLFFELVNAGC